MKERIPPDTRGCDTDRPHSVACLRCLLRIDWTKDIPYRTRASAAYIRLNSGGSRTQPRGRLAAGLTVFQRPLLLGAVNLAKIVDAGVGLRGLARPNVIGNSYRRQQADDRHNDHNLYQRKSRFARTSSFHQNYVCAVFTDEPASGSLWPFPAPRFEQGLTQTAIHALADVLPKD